MTSLAEAGGWHLGSRIERVRASHSYGVVLALVVATFVFAAVAGDGEWATAVLVLLQSVTFVTALWTAGVARSDSKLSVALVGGASVAAVALLVFGGNALAGAVGLLSALLTVATVAAIVVGVVDQREVNTQSVGGAVCIYLLFGIIFLYLYGAVAELGSGPLFAQGSDATRSIRLYFSYVTLATLGYGDYTPADGVGRMLAIVEALVGQLYLVTVVALLVSRMRGRRSED